MDLLLIMTYTAICIAIFKIFKLPLNKWTVPTAVLGGVVLIGGLMLVMNYNHPYTALAKQAFITTPIVPAVSGIVVEVAVEPNQLIDKGTVLFRVDPKPYEAIVRQKQALLAAGSEGVLELETVVAAARARVVQATADRDRSLSVFQRFERGGARGAFSEVEVENRRQLYLSNEAALDGTQSDLAGAQLAFESEIGGENPEVARQRADLDKARYDLERTVVRAPSAGFVTQLTLRPGMMAASLPLRPVMVFVPEEGMTLIAAFRQNSTLRLQRGYPAEVVFPAIPGRVFQARVDMVSPTMGEGQVQAAGALIGTEFFRSSGRVPVMIGLTEDISQFNLPAGSVAHVAVYSDHFSHFSIIRKILLRMSSWQNYLYFDH